jgi:hypothetical protein
LDSKRKIDSKFPVEAGFLAGSRLVTSAMLWLIVWVLPSVARYPKNDRGREEDVSSYWMTFKKREVSEDRDRKH